ncbi:hypothetical protein BGX31_011113 [Mortierella sp. GBA43]|nr:hypothetical protein BGX31_011113 [Mortierella sp. GBA43]
MQRNPHSQALPSHPPPVSPNRGGGGSSNPLALHSRILEDSTRFDTPRPTLTSLDAANASDVAKNTAAPLSPRAPQQIVSGTGGININRFLFNQRDHEREQRIQPSPLSSSSPHLTPPSSPSYNQYRGFARADNQGPADSGAAHRPPSADSDTNTNSDTVIQIDPESGVSSPDSADPADPADPTTSTSTSTEPESWISNSIRDQEHDYDLMVRHASQQIFNISSNIAVLERLIPCLGQRHKDTPELRESLHAVLSGTQDLVKSAHGLIKVLAKYHQPPTAGPQPNIGIRVQPIVAQSQLSSWQRKVLAGRRQTHQRLTKDLALASKTFQDLQRQAVEAERRQVATLKRLSGSASMQRISQYRADLMDLSSQQEEVEGGALLVNKGKAVVPNYGSTTNNGSNQTDHDRDISVQEEALLREILILDGELAFQESIIQEREYEIRKMEEGMGQVMDVMRELGTLVNEQRDGIDFLHDNIAQTRTRTHLAQQEVLKASEYQRRSREKLCYLLLVSSIVGAIVMLAFVST